MIIPKGYRPWRNRAVVYALIETGMRRSEAANLDLAGVDFTTRTLRIQIKGGHVHPYKISRQGLEAIGQYRYPLLTCIFFLSVSY